MGILDIFRTKKRSLENPNVPISKTSQFLDRIFGRSISGVTMSIDKALQIPSYYAACRVIMETMASLQVSVQVNKEGHWENNKDHPLHKIIVESPSPLYSSFTFHETGQLRLMTSGNMYARIIRRENLQIKELRLIDSVKNVFEINGELWYDLGESKMVNQVDIIHIPFFSKNGYTGESPVEMLAESLSWLWLAQQYGIDFFANGGNLNYTLTHPGTLSDAAKENLRKSFKNDIKNGAAVLEEGLTIKSVQATPIDSDLQAILNHCLRDVARITRVPLVYMQDYDKAPHGNYESQALDFKMHTIRPWVKRWEDEYNRKLILPSEQGKVRVRYNLDSLARADMQGRSEYYRTLSNIGALSPNDIRALEGMPPIEGGDKYLIPLNMTDINNEE